MQCHDLNIKMLSLLQIFIITKNHLNFFTLDMNQVHFRFFIVVHNFHNNRTVNRRNHQIHKQLYHIPIVFWFLVFHNVKNSCKYTNTYAHNHIEEFTHIFYILWNQKKGVSFKTETNERREETRSYISFLGQ